MIGILYFCVIIFANTIGAISGMGGGVLIKPIFDLINVHSVAAISFYSSVAVLTMSIVSTYKQLKNDVHVNWMFACQISIGAILGGMIGNTVFEKLLLVFSEGREVLLIQIVLTVVTLVFSFIYSKNKWSNFSFHSSAFKMGLGFLLGFLASLLGIGGGPINVALLMLLFNFPIKQATVYSIITIFFSQLSKIIIIVSTVDMSRYDLSMLYFIIPAAVLGGFFGSFISKKATDEQVNRIYQWVIILILMLNIYNGWKVF